MSKELHDVVGVTFEGRQQILSDFYKGYKVGGKYEVILEREPNNPYDKNAIAVHLDVGHMDYKQVGYISKNENQSLGLKLDKLRCARLNSMGPTAKGDLGLTIQVEFDD